MGLKESETTMFSHLYTKPECYRQTDRTIVVCIAIRLGTCVTKSIIDINDAFAAHKCRRTVAV